MLTARGFSAWITCEGKMLRELETVVDESSHRVSCWIGCEVGKAFTVHWRDNGTGIDSAGYILLDGFTCSGRFLYGYGDASRGTLRVDEHSERPFMFANPNAARRASWQADQATAPDTTPPSPTDTGTIVLKIRQIKRTAPTHPPNAPQAPPPPPSARPGARGPDAACISFGAPAAAPAQHAQTWAFVPHDAARPRAHVTFAFRYRTRAFLRAQGIVAAREALTAPPPPLLYAAAPAPQAVEGLEQEEEEEEEGEAEEGEGEGEGDDEDAEPAQQHTPASSPPPPPPRRSPASAPPLSPAPGSALSPLSSVPDNTLSPFTIPDNALTPLSSVQDSPAPAGDAGAGPSMGFFPLRAVPSVEGLKRPAEPEPTIATDLLRAPEDPKGKRRRRE
ncbi:hypothetical protein PsYK624_030940 [Phanerochaete sordida]|uniref:Uncharacterized protein n=1 Tax=Phanerochaete sordida TaxID=48140 RepID=A0A9P3L994_9APHY|nr:hypothetical protein PsYK624_030940 [Phanerochaete sordida]